MTKFLALETLDSNLNFDFNHIEEDEDIDLDFNGDE